MNSYMKRIHVLSPGSAQPDPLPPALDHTHCGPLSSLRSFARTNLPVLALGLIHVGSSLFSRAVGRSGPAAPVSALARLEGMPSAPEKAQAEPPMSSRSPARLGSVPSALDGMHVGSAILLRSHAHPEPAASTVGAGSSSVASSALDASHLEPSPLPRSFARPSSAVFVLAFSHLGSSMSLRSSARMGFAVSICGFASLDGSLSVLGEAHFGFTFSLKSPG